MGNKVHNVNDNEKVNASEYNVNDNVKKANNRANERAARVDGIADHLVRKFNAPNSRNFFCKCAWKLSENDIWTAYEIANNPKANIHSPLKYFITICQVKMSKIS